MERYLEAGETLEARWLVLRVLGIAVSAALVVRALPASLDGWAPLVAALAAVLAYGLPAEALRMAVARNAARAAPRLLQLLYPVELLAAPIAAPLMFIGQIIGKGVAPSKPDAKVTETEVEIIVNEGELNGSLAHDQSEMIRNVLDFGDLTAGEVMVPRTHVTAIDLEAPVVEVLREVSDSEHSRYPVYRENIDNVVGVLHVKDLITYAAADNDLDALDLDGMLRKPVAFVPESQLASSVLREMRIGRHHLAVVIDEFGGMSGIVTLEDLLEEIVGDIRDEHDIDEPILDLGNGHHLVDASLPIVDLNRHLGLELPEHDDYNSLGGLIINRLGRVPRVGAKFNDFGLLFVVREADARHVSLVEISPTPESASSSAA